MRETPEDSVVVPLPEIQIFGGGAHAGGRIDIQDLMVMAPGAPTFADALDWTAEIYRSAGALMPTPAGVADEGGWWPSFATNEQAIETLARSVERAGFVLGRDVVLSLDVAASELWRDGRYRLGLEARTLDSDEMIELVTRWCIDYSIASVEDPLGEHDAAGMRAFTEAVGARVQVVGDDIYVTNASRVAELDGVANAVLVKVNQAGTLSRAHDAVTTAAARDIRAIVSARSGESEDVTIAHLAVGWQVGQLKVGSMTRGERTAKWNEMIRIESALGERAEFAGWHPLPARPTKEASTR
jgi:enolase